MNYTTAVFLINSAVRAIACTYEAESSITAARTTFKTLDASIKVGDLVIVPTNARHNMTICKVAEVDVDVDFDSSAPMAWIVGKVDVVSYQDVLAKEGEAVDAIRSAEKTKKRAELAAALAADVVGLRSLAIAGEVDVPQAVPPATFRESTV